MWTRYRAVTKLNAAEDGEQVDALVYSKGAEAEAIYADLPLSNDEPKIYQTVFDAFQTYFFHRRYVIFERAQFYQRDWHEGDSMDMFVMVLRSIWQRGVTSGRRSPRI